MLSVIRKLFARRVPAARSRPAAAPRPRPRLEVEGLEDRVVPSGAYLQSGVLVAYGSSASDNIYISDDYSGRYTVSVNGRQVGAVSKSAVWQNTVRIFGNAGNDTIHMASWLSLRMVAYGGSGNDEIWGGRKDDALYGESDQDRIYGGDGPDYVDGGAGHDTLHGGNGNDTLVGWTGNDTFYGDAGKDYLYGGFGNDTFYLYSDPDSIYDGSGTNWAYKTGRGWYRV